MSEEELALKLTEIECKNSNVESCADTYLNILNKIDKYRVKFNSLIPIVRSFIKRIATSAWKTVRIPQPSVSRRSNCLRPYKKGSFDCLKRDGVF